MSQPSSKLFRLKGALPRDPAVEAWLDARPDELGTLARRWFGALRERGDDVRELIHDGCPVACVGDAAFGYVNIFQSHVNVGFFLGAELPDPARLLEGTGKRMRHVKLKPAAPLDSTVLQRLIEHAYADIRARLGASSDTL